MSKSSDSGENMSIEIKTAEPARPRKKYADDERKEFTKKVPTLSPTNMRKGELREKCE